LYEHLLFRTTTAKEKLNNEIINAQEKNNAASIDQMYLEKALFEDSLDHKRIDEEINHNQHGKRGV